MDWIIVITFSFLGGLVQTVSGFGAAVVMMLAFPFCFSLTGAPALASSIGLILSGSLTWRLRNRIHLSKVLLPTVIYTVLSISCVRLVKKMDMDLLGLCYGGFLIFLAAWYFLFSRKIQKKPGTAEMLLASVISGMGSGFFGIGGPLMAVYYSSLFSENLTYIASTQFNFFFGNFISLLMRIVSGIYTPDLIPYSLAGFAFILSGRELGLRIVNRIDGPSLKKIIYLIVGISGLATIAKYV